LWRGGGPWIGRNYYYPSYNSFGSNYGSSGGLAGGWNHHNDHNHDLAHGFSEGDHDDWSNLSYGGHKSRASGDRYSQNYEHDSGDDFGHDNQFNNGFDHGHNFYGGQYGPAWEGNYHVPYHYD
jgi:hypothetical protein